MEDSKTIVERNLGFRSEVEVSAIVSTYDAEKYMAKCLDDLLAQTLYQQGKAEIIVVDCNSPGNEGEIVRAYQASHPRITYVRIAERETLAGAWNIGAKYAEGEFVTNANTDDRHHPENFERLANALKENPEIDLVYADVFQSMTPNETFHENKQTVLYRYKPYFAPDVLINYQFGCQPMWRASVHEKCGYFDRTLKAASDYEFNFRFALAGCKAMHIAEPLGLFLERADSLSQGDKTSTDEQGALRRKYINVETMLSLYGFEGWDLSTKGAMIRALHDLSVRATELEYPWHPGQRFQDIEVALTAVTAALQLDQEHPTLLNNLAVFLKLIGNNEDAAQLMNRLQGQLLEQSVPTEVQENLSLFQSGQPFGVCKSLS